MGVRPSTTLGAGRPESYVVLGDSKTVIRGSRITVEHILRQLAQEQTIEQILRNYPNLTKEDIYTCLEYATERVEEEQIYPT